LLYLEEHMTMVIRLLTLVRWILVLPAAVVGTGVSRMEQRTQLQSGEQWLQRQISPGQGWRIVDQHPWTGTGLGHTEMRVRVVNFEYRFTVISQSNDQWEMQQLMREAPVIAQWAQRTYGGAPIEVIVKR
jgi:O-antigen ligase